MVNLGGRRVFAQAGLLGVALCLAAAWWIAATAQHSDSAETPVAVAPPAVAIPEAVAKSADEMKRYTEKLVGTDVTFEMLPIPGGEFVMGSSDSEPDRGDDEGPQHTMKIAPFWMGKCEVSWDEYDIFSYSLDVKRRNLNGVTATDREKVADAITKPTKPYTDMTFGKGHDGNPAICMTGLAAKTYCEWLSAKTGRFYRLPTEAEWEYACRAGTTTTYSFGDDPAQLGDYAWFIANSDEKPQKVGKKKPNLWGLHDMHGNVSEWCLDQYFADAYSKHGENPFFIVTKEYPQVVRGGNWEAEAATCRSAAREFSTPEWKVQDPQFPKSRWFHTDALFVGLRVVRPLAGEDIKLPPTEPNKPK
ncbi:MAG: formylglycine-generating enzyme family protein [Planctomycetaceae bacterium]|nr:formylglycine-generating enzyme family protein [Planctomycetaceae bacterium]